MSVLSVRCANEQRVTRRENGADGYEGARPEQGDYAKKCVLAQESVNNPSVNQTQDSLYSRASVDLHFLHLVRIQLFLDPLRKGRRQTVAGSRLAPPVIGARGKSVVHGQIGRKRESSSARGGGAPLGHGRGVADRGQDGCRRVQGRVGVGERTLVGRDLVLGERERRGGKFSKIGAKGGLDRLVRGARAVQAVDVVGVGRGDAGQGARLGARVGFRVGALAERGGVFLVEILLLVEIRGICKVVSIAQVRKRGTHS
ncbi:hypothetical protein AG1IA_06754 [Rhizoctonia solani AG-1 IA]|uniref:Uncharacterized protein n=1 Tax=Thanatephorus cucumeris (strain AG1-IA) TaxID=983506 RepID=L8WR05_THACA|nr:hypothetical protein AG1IA_06754 [Rhizoctonia solani AG-1 IA]